MRLGHRTQALLVDGMAAGEAVEVKASFKGWGRSSAMVWANTQPEAGVALKPP